MRYLIDTNTFLFYIFDIGELDDQTIEILNDYENSIIISSESIREIRTLMKDGRIDGIRKWRSYDDVKSSLEEHRIEIRYVSEAHLKMLFNLRPAPNHSDPADLMIISQAITEKIPLISSDNKFPLYVPQGLNFIHNRRGAAARARRMRKRVV